MIVNDVVIEPITVISGAATYPTDVLNSLEDKYKIVKVDANKIAEEVGNRRVFNTVVLGVAARHMGVEKEVWLRVIERTVPPKTVEINKKAFLTGLGE